MDKFWLRNYTEIRQVPNGTDLSGAVEIGIVILVRIILFTDDPIQIL